MIFKRILPITIILLVGLFGYSRFLKPCGGNVDYTFQNGWQDSFAVRVERKPEACGFAPALAGAEYIFSARPEGFGDWRRIMTLRLDAPQDIPKDSINILDEKTAVVFMENKYAVTDDKGKTWTMHDINKDFGLKNVTDSRISFGKEGFVALNTKVADDAGREFDAPHVSHDFGKTWQPVGK